jgi:hypothetical protein
MSDGRMGKPLPGRAVVWGCAVFFVLLVLVGTLFVVKTVKDRQSHRDTPSRPAR